MESPILEPPPSPGPGPAGPARPPSPLPRLRRHRVGLAFALIGVPFVVGAVLAAVMFTRGAAAPPGPGPQPAATSQAR